MSIPISVSDKLSPALQQAASVLSGPNRVLASQAMAVEVRKVIVTHIQKEALLRHTTADRLGGTHTRFMELLGEKLRPILHGIGR